jgi:hypothetical protein
VPSLLLSILILYQSSFKSTALDINNDMAGIKISNLPAASTPLAGSETIAIVQSTCTKSTPISAIADIVSSSFVTSSQYASTSGAWTTVNSTSANWSGVYSSYQSTSASVARKDACNCFVCPQIFTSVINASKIAAGYSATANGACSSVLGGYYNDANGNGSVVVAGNNNDTWGNFSSIAGGENNCITLNALVSKDLLVVVTVITLMVSVLRL